MRLNVYMCDRQVDNSKDRSNIVSFCAYAVTSLGCDGIHLDFEPMNGDDSGY